MDNKNFNRAIDLLIEASEEVGEIRAMSELATLRADLAKAKEEIADLKDQLRQANEAYHFKERSLK
jgi:predicted  nucleic acid-binding Zn-ribbon protein